LRNGENGNGTQEAQEAQENVHFLVPLVLLVFRFSFFAKIGAPNPESHAGSGLQAIYRLDRDGLVV
jgi:hypothetical protein